MIRRRWKVKRDVAKRGYNEDEVAAELARREPESAAYIRPQRAHADIVVRFAPIEERGETPDDPLSAYVMLRPTIAHPDLSGVISEDTRKAAHLKLLRDEDGKPVDALHVHAYAERTPHRAGAAGPVACPPRTGTVAQRSRPARLRGAQRAPGGGAAAAPLPPLPGPRGRTRPGS